MSGQLNGKVAIVTGGASGIGAASAAALARDGATVIVSDINLAGAKAVADELIAEGGSAEAMHLDIGDHQAIEQVVAAVLSTWGGIDIVINNAVHVDPEDRQMADNDFALWQRQLTTNLIGPAMLSRAALPSMIGRGGGAFVHMASAAGIRAEDMRSCYGTAKAGLFAMSRSIAVQYGKRGIRSNCIAPGLVLTPAAAATFDPDMLELFRDHHMTPELGTAEQIASTVAYLCSPAAAFITGHVLVADGGFSTAATIVPALRKIAATQ